MKGPIWRKSLVVAACGCLVLLSVGTGCAADTKVTAGWHQVHPDGQAPSGGQAAMVYDERAKRILVFARAKDGPEIDVWFLDLEGRKWVDIQAPSVRPPYRTGFSVAYDNDAQKVLLFGGEGSQGYLCDTWIYDPRSNAWNNVDDGGLCPAPRKGQAMVYDPVSRRVVLFGGGRTDAHFHKANDTWTYDFTAGAWTEVRTTNYPAARMWHSMSYDTANGNIIMFGGESSSEFGAVMNDTWALDIESKTWTRLEPEGAVPSGRVQHAMVLDQSTGIIVLFGGSGADTTALGDTWLYDGLKNAWTKPRLRGKTPACRQGQSLVYDTESNRVVLFGGYKAWAEGPGDRDGIGGSLLSDVWVFDAAPR